MHIFSEATTGAIVAALIAAIASLLGLIISKEQKTSEFRQAWIDSLRADIASYLTASNSLFDGESAEYPNHLKKLEALSPFASIQNTASFNIQLRINPQEPLSDNLLSAMNALHTTLSNTINMDQVGELRAAEASVIKASQELLKGEWRRVKEGELTFRCAKYLSFIVILAAVVILLIFQFRAPITHSSVRNVSVPGAPVVKAKVVANAR